MKWLAAQAVEQTTNLSTYLHRSLAVQAGHVASPALTRAFFDLYVGADPVLTVSYLGD